MQQFKEDVRISKTQRQQVLAALDAILQTKKFQAAPQMSAFLRFVVQQAADGHQSRIRAFTVAVEALGKAHSFDPQNDPVVRVLAGRLRAALVDYHAENPIASPRITIQRGTYVPEFSHAVSPPAPNVVPISGEHRKAMTSPTLPVKANQEITSSLRIRHGVKTAMTTSAAAFLLFAVYKAAVFQKQSSQKSETDSSAQDQKISIIRPRPDHLSLFISATNQGTRLQHDLSMVISGALSGSEDVRIHRILNEKPSINFWPEDYILTLSAMDFTDETRVSLQLMDAQTGRISHTKEISLDAHAGKRMKQQDISNVIDAALNLVCTSCPMFDDYNRKAAP